MKVEKKETREEFYDRIGGYEDKQDITFLKKKHEFADIYSFTFKPHSTVNFEAGMFAHVVLHDLPEEAGKPVRYLSIASAPSDENLQFTTHVREGSLHKQKLAALEAGDSLSIYKVKGKFVLPRDKSLPVILLAGGIGITPYRSMMCEEAHLKSSRDITLVHVSDNKYLFENELALLPFSQHRIGRNDIHACMKTLYKEKENGIFYVSGPPSFVDTMKEVLMKIGVKENNIKQDWFDGYDDF